MAQEPMKSTGSQVVSGISKRIAASILVGTFSLALVLLYLAFWSQRFDWLQNLVMVGVLFLGAVGVLAAMWISFGTRFATPAMPGVRWRAVVSILGGTFTLIFVLLYLAFWSTFDWLQNLVVLLAFFLMAAGILAALWTAFGMRFGGVKLSRVRWRAVVSELVGTFSLAPVLLYLTFWSDFDWFQNLIILVVALLVVGGILGAMWVSLGMRMGGVR